jgi:squalene-associated FAD-dependent desaturase
VQPDLRIDWADQRGLSTLACPPLPAPLHLLAGLLRLRLPWRVRWQAVRLGLAVRFGAVPHGLTLAEYLARHGQGAEARRLLWDPLATAILNETPERAAAVLFHTVYREAFLANHRASRLAFLRRGFGALHARLARYLESRGGVVRLRARAEALLVEGGRAAGVRYAGRGGSGRLEADAVVAAVPWDALPGLLPEDRRAQAPFAGLAALGASPIVSVEVWLDRVVLDRPMVGLRDSELEWVFDKGRLFGRQGPPQHLGFIVSAARRAVPQLNAELAATADETLRRHFPAMAGARITRCLVMREPRATFSATPASQSLRPGSATPIPGLFLAGDWTDTGLPATIEGAVRSGFAAARAVEAVGW